MVLNQVLVRLAGGDEVNRAIVDAVQRDGTCWLGGTEYDGRYVMRISFCNWATTDEDVDRSAAAIVAAAASVRGDLRAAGVVSRRRRRRPERQP